jgi:hypothetical protein
MEGSRVCASLALVLITAAACGPGRLPDLGFGSAGKDAGETVGGDGDPGDGDGPSTSTSTSTSASTSTSTSTSGSTGDGDDPETTTTTSGTSTGTSASTRGDELGDDGDEVGDDGDGDPNTDTWGIPPDVTNEPCEALSQDCFPTHKCVPFASQPNTSFLDANKCMPILGDKQWGEPCTLSSFQEGQDDCDGQGFCWNLEWVQGQLHGTCVPFCVGTPQNLSCPIGWGCLFTGAVALCPVQCDPLLQSCPGDYGCFWAGNHFQCALVSKPSGQGEACEKYPDCLPGFGCVDKALQPGCGDASNPGCCAAWCDLEAPDCGAGLECVAFFDDVDIPAWLANIGICVV